MSIGINRRSFIQIAGGVGAGLALANKASAGSGTASKASAAGLVVPKMDVVRMGFIGVGARGGGHVNRFMKVEGVEVKAICDNFEQAAKNAQARCVKAGRPAPDIYTKGDLDYRRMLERDDIDVVLVATPWNWHAKMCVDAMNAGKHALTEVPAAITTQECWDLVNTAEKTQKNCMMLENVCYGRDELMALNMCRQGALGELLHGECAYIHPLSHQMGAYVKGRGTGSWRTVHHMKRNGNLYPTHGLGPIAQYMNINRGDRFDYMSSMSSPALGRALYAKKKWPDHEISKKKFICGDMNTSIIKTVKGRSIMLQHDTTTPRPYDRLNLIQGTNGVFASYPSRVCLEEFGSHKNWNDIEKCYAQYDHPLWANSTKEMKGSGHGGMDGLMTWRIIYCLRNGEPLDQDIYDAASWSVVGPLSEESVANRSDSVDVPDFTRGKWKTMKPLGIVEA